MAPGGLSNFCDDCGYQACLKANCCLQVQGDVMGVDPQELVLDGPIWIGVDVGGPDLTVRELAFLRNRPFPKFPDRLEDFQRLFLVTILKVDDQVIRSEGVRRE